MRGTFDAMHAIGMQLLHEHLGQAALRPLNMPVVWRLILSGGALGAREQVDGEWFDWLSDMGAIMSSDGGRIPHLLVSCVPWPQRSFHDHTNDRMMDEVEHSITHSPYRSHASQYK